MRVLIVLARFYEDIAEALLAGAAQALEAADTAFDVIEVPGALEIPAAVAMAIPAGEYDGYVALGCVIRGETSHYDIVCAESARGLADLAILYRAAIGNGILTVENEVQAWERAAPDRRNKGGDAARACLAMLRVREKLSC